MASSRVSSVSLVIAGLLLLLAAGAHAGLGWPAMREELTRLSASPDLIAGLGAITSGGRVFWASLIVGLAYGGFGLATCAIYRESHFLGFVAIGLAVVGSVRALGRRG